VIPGRTGTQLLPQDIAMLHQQYPNVSAVKEATGDLENMRLTRKLCGANFNILSGDDDKTYTMMTAQDIAASGVISVTSNITQEQTPYGAVTCKARNPLAYKTLMNMLGMPSGTCRQPLGKMTRNGLEVVLANARKVYENHPEILQPVEDFFSVDLMERLYKERFWQGLTYA
jgi:4-hydroxy-tetrahydrodipicolinate synthase